MVCESLVADVCSADTAENRSCMLINIASMPDQMHDALGLRVKTRAFRSRFSSLMRQFFAESLVTHKLWDVPSDSRWQAYSGNRHTNLRVDRKISWRW